MTIRHAAWALAASLVIASTADAQVVVGPAPAGGAGGGYAPSMALEYGYSAPFRTSYAGGAPSVFVPTYSYYAAYPYPARGYAGLRNDAFPFYGWPPYGHTYDRWSWAYLGGYYNRLNRYFYEPLR